MKCYLSHSKTIYTHACKFDGWYGVSKHILVTRITINKYLMETQMYLDQCTSLNIFCFCVSGL